MASTIAGAVAGKNAFTGNGPTGSICGWLHGFHVYANDPSRYVSSHHFCTMLGDGTEMRQCLIYDSPDHKARLIGVEYMISPKIFSTLPKEEQRYWHTHNFEVKSGMLVMPQPSISPMPKAAWEAVEDAEVNLVTTLYGKTYHLWQVDRGDLVPLGEPQLMGSFTSEDQFPSQFYEDLKKRDEALGVDTKEKKTRRENIKESDVATGRDVDIAWKKGGNFNDNTID